MRLPRKMKKKLKATGKNWKYFIGETTKKLTREECLDVIFPEGVPSITETLSAVEDD